MSPARVQDRGLSPNPIPNPKPEILPPLLAVVQGPSQAPLSFSFSSVIKDVLVHLFRIVGGTPCVGA